MSFRSTRCINNPAVPVELTVVSLPEHSRILRSLATVYSERKIPGDPAAEDSTTRIIGAMTRSWLTRLTESFFFTLALQTTPSECVCYSNLSEWFWRGPAARRAHFVWLPLGSTMQENQRARSESMFSDRCIHHLSMYTGCWAGISSLWSGIGLFSSHLCILGKPFLERQHRMAGFKKYWVFQVAIIPHCNFKEQSQWLSMALGFDSWFDPQSTRTDSTRLHSLISVPSV